MQGREGQKDTPRFRPEQRRDRQLANDETPLFRAAHTRGRIPLGIRRLGGIRPGRVFDREKRQEKDNSEEALLPGKGMGVRHCRHWCFRPCYLPRAAARRWWATSFHGGQFPEQSRGSR